MHSYLEWRLLAKFRQTSKVVQNIWIWMEKKYTYNYLHKESVCLQILQAKGLVRYTHDCCRILMQASIELNCHAEHSMRFDL